MAEDRTIGGFFKDALEGTAYKKWKEENPSFVPEPTWVTEGVSSGASNAFKGLAQFTALPIDLISQNIDFIPDTNVLQAIEDVWPKIEANSTGAEVVSLLTQFGLPFGVVAKLAGPLVKLKRVKFSDFTTTKNLGSSTAKLAQNAGFYGSVAGVTDTIFSAAGTNKRLISDETYDSVFGKTALTSDIIDPANPLSILKEKIKFGAEGTLLGAIPTLLPAGLGATFGLFKETASLAAPVVGPVIRGLNYVVDNTLVKAMTKDGKYSLPQVLREAQSKIASLTKDLPPMKEWSIYDPNSPQVVGKAFGFKTTESFLKSMDNLLSKFRSRGEMTPEAAQLIREGEAAFNVDVKFARQQLDQINEKIYDVGARFRKNFFDKGTSEEVMQSQKDTIFDFLKGNADLKQIDKSLRLPVIRIKKLLKIINKHYGEALDPKLTNELGKIIIQDSDTYLKQTFSSFYNQYYNIDPKVRSKAVAGLQEYIMGRGQQALRDSVIDRMGANAKANPFKTMKTPEFQAALKEKAEKMVQSIVTQTRNSTYLKGGKYTPEQIIRNIGTKILKMDKKVVNPGELFPDYVRKLLGEVKDVDNAVLNTVIQNSKLIYQKKLYDGLVKDGLKNKWLFETFEKAELPRAMGGIDMVNASGRLQAIPRGKQDLFVSDMFEPGSMAGSKYVTTPEIANAIAKIDETSRGWMNLPWYRSLMTLKAGAQFSKTVLSPMTQIRNVTSASMFALANGLIGGRVNLLDSFRAIADDIAGKEGVISSKKFQEIVDDKIRRGVMDQNIITGELKKVFSGSKNGEFQTVDGFMKFLTDNKFMRRATDLYGGGDNAWKWYADEFYIDALKPAIKDLKDVKLWYKDIAGETWNPNNIWTGNKKTLDDGIKDISAYLLTNTMPTYSKVPEIIKVIRSLPVGNFIAFPAEMFRTSANIITIGAKEMTSANPYLRQMGARRLLGLATTTYGAGKAVEETAKYVTKVYDDEINAFKRSFAPFYEKNAQIIPVSGIDRNGNFKYINYSYFNPYDTIARMGRAGVNAFINGEVRDRSTMDNLLRGLLFYDETTGAPGALFEFLTPFVDEALATEKLLDISIRQGKKRDGGEVYNETDSWPTIIAKSMGHVYEALEPGAFRTAKRIYQGVSGNYTDYGSMVDGATEFTALATGFKLQNSKPKNSVNFILSSHLKDLNNINLSFSRKAYSANNSLEDKLNIYGSTMKKSFDAQKRLYQVYLDSKTLGFGSDFEDIVKNRFNRSDYRALINGEFKAPTFSEERIDSALERMVSEARSMGRFPDRDKMRALEQSKDAFKDLKNSINRYSLRRDLDRFNYILDRVINPTVEREKSIRDTGLISKPDQRSSVPSLGNITVAGTAPVSQQVVSVVNPLAGMIQGTGLTASENALLSNEEKAIRMRQKGIS